MGYKEMYADKAYCISEIHEARRIFTTFPFTPEKGDLLLKGLTLMLLYCPEEITSIVEATIYECERRITYVAIGVVKPKPAPDFDAIAQEIQHAICATVPDHTRVINEILRKHIGKEN
jgi:hypothetical protein